MVCHGLVPSPQAPQARNSLVNKVKFLGPIPNIFSLHSGVHAFNVLKVTMPQERALTQEIQLGSPDGYFPCERVGSRMRLACQSHKY